MPQVKYDPSSSVVVVDCLLESADGTFSLVIPVALDTGASFTVVATDILVQLGYDPANPLLKRRRIVTGSGIEYAPRMTLRSVTAIGQKVTNLEVLCHDLPAQSGIDGLLGLNFLRRFRLTIRFRKGIVELVKER
jgi:predicted aspartyl protease